MLTFSETNTSDELIVNKSKFIGFTLIGDSREIFIKKVSKIAQQHGGANHLAFAYQIKSKNSLDAYFFDAGEPSGTAGKPLLTILESKKMVNAGIAVVRYYCGVNLVTGGLARAYSKAGMMAFSATKTEEFIQLNLYILTIKYNMLGIISNLISENRGVIVDKKFDVDIHLLTKLTEELALKIENDFSSVKINRANEKKGPI